MLGELGVLAGLLIALGREWVAARDRRRARPVVVVHEERGRHFRDDGGQAVDVWLSNESSATAFNIRFGVELNGVEVPFKYASSDPGASRQNVLASGKRLPEAGTFEVAIPELVWAGAGDADPGRVYWAEYQSPSGEWWRATNPWARHADFKIARVQLLGLSRRQRERKQPYALQEGEKALEPAQRKLAGGLRRRSR